MDKAHALALLGLAEGSTPREVRQQYRRLIERWHPDQFVSDPAGFAEAAARTCQLNQALALLEAEPRVDVPFAPAHDTPQFGRRLTPEEVDEISNAIGRESWTGFMGRLIAVLVPFYFGAILLGQRGRLGHLYALSEYERLLAYGSIGLGVGLGWLFFRRRR